MGRLWEKNQRAKKERLEEVRTEKWFLLPVSPLNGDVKGPALKAAISSTPMADLTH